MIAAGAIRQLPLFSRTGDPAQTVRALTSPALGLEHLIVPNGAPLYHTELDYIRRESRHGCQMAIARF